MKNSSSGLAVLKNCTTAWRAINFGAHAVAGVEDHPQGHWDVLAREVPDILQFLTFKYFEVVFLQSCDGAVREIGNAHR